MQYKYFLKVAALEKSCRKFPFFTDESISEYIDDSNVPKRKSNKAKPIPPPIK
jgi:hypothetical protein